MRRAQGRGLESLTLPPLRPSEIVRSVVRILRIHTVRIVGLAALVFGTTAAFEALIEVKVVDGGFSSGVEAIARFSTAMIGAFGFVFYAGLLDLVVGAHHRGEPDPTVREVIHRLPHGKLVVADVTLVVICGVLALFFVVPGVIALTFFCLIGPVIVTEQHTVIDAFRRSARLVRPHFWMVLFIVVIPLLVEDQIMHGLDIDLIGTRVIDEFLVNAAIGAAVGSVVGLLEVVLAHEFRARDPLPDRLPETGATAA